MSSRLVKVLMVAVHAGRGWPAGYVGGHGDSDVHAAPRDGGPRWPRVACPSRDCQRSGGTQRATYSRTDAVSQEGRAAGRCLCRASAICSAAERRLADGLLLSARFGVPCHPRLQHAIARGVGAALGAAF